MKTRDILLLLGAYNLSDVNEHGVFSASASQVILHPDWNPYVEKYDADIAAIILEGEVPYTQFIRPVCIASSSLEIDSGFASGFVTGWGKSEDQTKIHENIPKELSIPIWTNEHCFLESNEFVKVASKRTFCAGSRDGRGVCSGDSGGGLFIQSGDAYFLKGLISASLLDRGECDVSNFALFTNVNWFTEWIDVPTEEVSSSNANLQAPTSCGVMSSTASLVQNGKKSSKVQWPWVVVVSNKQFTNTVEDVTYSAFEVGTLISNRHVIADGMFVSKVDDDNPDKRKPTPVDAIKTYFGVTELDDYASTNSLVLDGADKIIIHPDLGNIHSLKFANFAIIKLKTFVTFSQYIAPICLSSFTGDPYLLSGQFAYGVGMGYSATGKTKDRRYAPMRIRTKDVCDDAYEFNLGTAKNKSVNYFCAGGDGGINACWSDHPLYLKSNGKWFLHGFMQIAYNDGKGCSTTRPVLYETAGLYYQFILNQIGAL